jgi:hypothetical protein
MPLGWRGQQSSSYRSSSSCAPPTPSRPYQHHHGLRRGTPRRCLGGWGGFGLWRTSRALSIIISRDFRVSFLFDFFGPLYSVSTMRVLLTLPPIRRLLLTHHFFLFFTLPLAPHRTPSRPPPRAHPPRAQEGRGEGGDEAVARSADAVVARD